METVLNACVPNENRKVIGLIENNLDLERCSVSLVLFRRWVRRLSRVIPMH